MAGSRRITIEFLGDARNLQAGAQSAEGALGKLGDKFKSFGKLAAGALAGAGVAGGAALVAGLMAGMENEKQLDRASAALGLTPAQSKELGDIGGRLYAQAYGESMGDVTSALESVKSSFADLGGSQLEAVTAQAMDFASVFETDLPASVATAQTVVRSGLAKDATEAFDLMTAAMQKVPAALRENVADAATEYAPYLADLGISGEQAFAMLAAGAAQGEVGIDKIGDSLKEFSIRATDMSAGSKAAYDALGLNAREMSNDILAGGETAASATQKIVDGLSGIRDPAAQAEAAIALFGTPLEDLGVAGIPDFLASLQTGAQGLGDFQGATERAGKTLNDNAATNLESFKRQLTTGFVDLIGGKVLPKLNEFSAVIAQNVGPTVAALRTRFDEIRPTLARLGEFFGTVFTDVKAIVTDAVVIVEALWARFGGILTDYAVNTLANLQTIFGGAFEVIRGIFQTFSALLQGDWGRAWEGVKRIVAGAWQMVTGIVRQAANGVVTVLRGLGSAVTGIFSGIWSGVTHVVSRGIGNVVDAFRAVPGRLLTLGASFMSAGGTIIGKLMEGLSNVGGLIGGVAGAIKRAVIGALNDVIQGMNDALPNSLLGVPVPPNPIPPIPGYARGTNFAPGGLAIVGEQGPELVNLPRGSKVTPNHQSVGQLRGLGGGDTINITVNGALDPLAVAGQIEKMLVQRERRIGRPLAFRTA